MRTSVIMALALFLSAFAANAQEPAPVKQDQSNAEQPKADQPKTDQSKVDQPMDGPKKNRGNRELRKEIQDQIVGLGDSMRGPDGDNFPPPPPHGANGDAQGQGPNYDFMRRAVEMNLSEDEKNALKRLAFEKPDEFRDEIKKRFQAARQKRMDDFKKTGELQKAYRDAATPDDKAKAFERLKALVAEQFNQKMELNKKHLEETENSLKNAEKRLEDFKLKYEERKAKADEIINDRVKELIKDPDLDW